MSLTVGTLVGYLDVDDKKFNAGVDAAGSKWSGLGKGMEKVGATLTKSVTLPMIALGAVSIKVAADIEKGMNEVFTLMPGISKEAMGKMTADVKDFSREFGVLPNETIPALYQAISAGVPSDNVFSFLETAQKAAVGGVTDLTTAVDGISSVVNAYGSEVISATQASDLMFTAVRLGKTDFQQLSSSLFNVIPTAAALGVEFGDVTAALAAMTAQGVPTSVATTQLRQMFVELSKEGTNTSKIFQDMAGVTFKDFIAAGGNTADALEILEKYAKDAGLGVNDLFGSVEAGAAALSLTGGNMDTFRGNLDEMAKSAGATEEAYNQMDQGVSRALERIKVEGMLLLADIGEKLIPVLEQLIPVVGRVVDAAVGLLDWFSNLSEGTQNFILALGGIAVVAGPLIGTLGKLASAIAAVGAASSAAAGAGAAGAAGAGGAAAAGGLAGLGAKLAAMAATGGPVIALVAAFGLLGYAISTGGKNATDANTPFLELTETINWATVRYAENAIEMAQANGEWVGNADETAAMLKTIAERIDGEHHSMWESIVEDCLNGNVTVKETTQEYFSNVESIINEHMWAAEGRAEEAWLNIEADTQYFANGTAVAVQNATGQMKSDWEDGWVTMVKRNQESSTIVLDRLEEVPGLASSAVNPIIQLVGGKFADTYTRVSTEVESIRKKSRTEFAGMPGDASSAAAGLEWSLNGPLDRLFGNVVRRVANIRSEIRKISPNIPMSPPPMQVILEGMGELEHGMDGVFDAIFGNTEKSVSQVRDVFASMQPDGKIATLWETAIDHLITVFQKLTTSIEASATRIVAALERIAATGVEAEIPVVVSAPTTGGTSAAEVDPFEMDLGPGGTPESRAAAQAARRALPTNWDYGGTDRVAANHITIESITINGGREEAEEAMTVVTTRLAALGVGV